MLQPDDTIQPKTKLCDVTYLDNGVMQVTFWSPSREACNVYLQHLEKLFQRDSKGPLILQMLDATNTRLMSLGYMIQQVKGLMTRYPNRPGSRTAIVTRPDPMLSMAATSIRFMRLDAREHAVRFFTNSHQGDALTWLVSSQQEYNVVDFAP